MILSLFCIGVLVIGLVVIPGLLPKPDGSPGFLVFWRQK